MPKVPRSAKPSGGHARDDGVGGDVAGHDRSRTHEGPLPHAATLQDLGAGPHGASDAQPHGAADVGPGKDRRVVLEDGVVTDGGAVLDLHVVAEADAAADVRERHDDRPASQARVGADDGLRVHERPRHQTALEESGTEPPAHARVCDADDEGAPAQRVAQRPDPQPAHGGARAALVEERGDRLSQREGDVERLAPGAPRADDVEVHGRQSAPGAGADGLALGLVGLLAAWVAFGLGETRPELLVLVLAAASYGAGRGLSTLPLGLPVASGLVAVGAVTVLATATVDGSALSPPLGYGNANGALAALAVGAALLPGLSSPRRAVRLLGVGTAAALLPLCLLTASHAAVVVAAGLVVLGAAVAVRPSLGRPVPRLTAAAVLLALAGTVAVGLRGRAPAAVEAALSDRRVVLWSESLDLLRAHPLSGVGVGAFRTSSPTAVADPDAAWAHSVWLQQGAETGVIGMALLLALALLLLLRVRSGLRDRGVGAVGTAVLGGVLLQASIDYVLHFPAVVGVAALLAGLSARWRPRPRASAAKAPGSRGSPRPAP